MPKHKVQPPSPPFVPARWMGDPQTPALLVIHSTVSPCEPGGAQAIAEFFAQHDEPTSAHYTIDPETERQCVPDHRVAYHCGYNEDSLAFEMCDIPGPVPGDKPGTARWKALRRAWRWARPAQKAMLRRTALLVARSALAYGIPLRYLTTEQLLAWDRGGHRPTDGGIVTHAQMSATFHRSVHWDPGWWPRRRFLKLARKYAAELEAGREPEL